MSRYIQRKDGEGWAIKNGEIFRVVNNGSIAWHAGVSTLFGVSGVNNFSLGVELVGHSVEARPLEQMTSLVKWTVAACIEYKIPLNHVVGHCHVSPGRKTDPGGLFPWFAFLNDVGRKML